MNIYLIGYRCTGKTSVGKALAKRLAWQFIDADSYLVEKYGMTVAEIVSEGGWESFRDKESNVVKILSELDRHVIATGGGVILREENVKKLKESGKAIWLKATKENIKQRMLADMKTEEQRPSLTSFELDKEIEETLLSRNPLYKDAMAFYVDTDDVSIDGVCETIAKRLQGETE